MSDYIRKSALIEILNLYEKELHEDKRDAIDTEDEMMLFAIQNQETAISRITRSVLYELPTLDEKEIIRKAFERVLERLEEYWKSHKALEDYEMFNGTYIEMKQQEMVVKAYEKAIEIVKEECGISE